MILSYVILLFFPISFFNMCTFYFAHNMFNKDSLACVDVFFPFDCFATCSTFYEKLGIPCSNTVLFALVIGPSLGFKEWLIGFVLIPIFGVSVAWCGWFLSFFVLLEFAYVAYALDAGSSCCVYNI